MVFKRTFRKGRKLFGRNPISVANRFAMSAAKARYRGAKKSVRVAKKQALVKSRNVQRVWKSTGLSKGYRKPTDFAQIPSSASHEIIRYSLQKNLFPKRNYHKGTGILTVEDQSATNSVADSGFQATTILTYGHTASQWMYDGNVNTNSTYMAHYGPDEGPIRFFGVNPNAQITGNIKGNFYNAVSEIHATKLVATNYSISVSLTNLSTNANRCNVYCVMYKKDLNTDPITAWDNCLIRDSTMISGQTSGGFAGQNFAQVSPSNLDRTITGRSRRDLPGATPNDAPSFKKMFKVLSVKTFDISAGSTHELFYHFDQNKVADEQTFLEQNPSGLTNSFAIKYLKGWTTAIFLTNHGAPVKNTVALGSPMTWGSTAIGAIVKRKFHFRTLKANSGQQNISIAASQVSTSVPLANQSQAGLLLSQQAVVIA